MIGRPDAKWQEVPVAYIVRARRRERRAGRDRGLLPGPACALQGAARVRVRRQPAAQRHGQGAALPAQGADRGAERSGSAPRGSGKRMRIAVLGGGNGSFAAAGDFALAGHEVRLWRRDGEAVEAHRAAGGIIAIKDFRGRHEARLRLVTTDIGEAVQRAELIVCPAPATAQADIARALAPHLARRPGGVPAAGHLRLDAVRRGRSATPATAPTRSFAETGTLPWLARKHGPFEVGDHRPRQAAADRRIPRCAAKAMPSRCWIGVLSRRHRAVRRCAVRRADERRARSSTRR